MLFSGDARFRVTVARVQFFERCRMKAKSFVLTVGRMEAKVLCRRSRMEAKVFVSAV